MKRNYTNLFYAVLLLTSLSSAGEIRLKNYAKNTSLNFRHDHGGSDQYYYVESIGAGACVFDYDGDGILELLISHGESGAQPLSLFKANVSNRNYIRIKPLNTFGAPARGATVTLRTNLRNHAKTIDAGSGYLCQMEPVAHYGLRKDEVIKNISIKWTNGTIDSYEINDINITFEFKQGI